MADVVEDLQILYRAVSRRQGRSIAYAGCVMSGEARRLVELGLARLIDVCPDGLPGARAQEAGAPGAGGTPEALPFTWPGASPGGPAEFVAALRRAARADEILLFASAAPGYAHAAATAAAGAGFHGVLTVLDE